MLKRRVPLVFVSHSGMDAWIAKQIARAVDECGAQAFLAEADVDAGTYFDDEVRKVLNEADELVVLFTTWVLARPYVWAELGAAWGRGIPIVGLLLGITTPELQARPEIPIFIKGRDLLELNRIDQYLEQLRRRVRMPQKEQETNDV